MKPILLLLLLAWMVGWGGFVWLYGPQSAWNVGDIVVHDHKNNLFRVPTYADSLNLQASWLEGRDIEADFRRMKLYSEAAIEYLNDSRIALAEIRRVKQ